MRLNSSLRTVAAFGVLAAALAGCSSTPEQGQGQAQGQGQQPYGLPPMHRGATTGAGYSGSMGSTGSGPGPGAAADVAPGQMGPGMGVQMMQDQQQMCDLASYITHANSPEERQSLMDKYFAGMSPQMQQQHLDMMTQQCGR
jgi:hypothetical protein